LWRVTTGERLGPPLPHQGPVNVVAWSPDARMVFTGTFDTGGQLWDALTGQPLGPPLPHTRLTRAAFSTDGARLVTGSAGGTVRFWQTATGKPLSPHVDTSLGSLFFVGFSPDGRVVRAVNSEHQAVEWAVPEPVMDQPDRVTLWAQVRSCLELDGDDVPHDLDTPTWLQRRQQLENLGGPPLR
jgi:WD40 repeat protein